MKLVRKNSCVRFFLLGILWIAASFQTSFADSKNPCEDAELCRKINWKDAVSLPWDIGKREFKVGIAQEVEIEGYARCPDCLTYSKLFATCSFQDLQNGSKPMRLGHLFTNNQKIRMEIKAKFRENYRLYRTPEGFAKLDLKLEVLNGQTPTGVKYQFRVKTKLRSDCFLDETTEFLTLIPAYNDATESLWEEALTKALKRTPARVVEMGDSRSGFKMPLIKIIDGDVRKGSDSFGYKLLVSDTQLYFSKALDESKLPILPLTYDNAYLWNGSKQIFSPEYASSHFVNDAKAFLNIPVQNSEPEFWITAATDKMYMVFPNGDSSMKPIVFTLTKEKLGELEKDGDTVFPKDKLPTTMVIIGHLGSLKSLMRGSSYAPYSPLSGAFDQVKDLLQMRGPDGKPTSLNDATLKRSMRIAFLLLNYGVKPKILQDRKAGEKYSKPLQQIEQMADHLFKDYGFDKSLVKSSSALYAIYAEEANSAIENMTRNSDGTYRDEAVFAKTKELVQGIISRKGLSDANIQTGLNVDQLLLEYDRYLVPSMDQLRKEGRGWSGNDIRLATVIEGMRLYREVDQKKGIPASMGGGELGPSINNDPLRSGVNPPGEMPRPK